MTDVTWQDPPPDRRRESNRNGRLQRLAVELRASPGRWALVGDYAGYQVAATINRGERGYAPPGAFEAVSRLREDGRFDIYARYVGDDQEG